MSNASKASSAALAQAARNVFNYASSLSSSPKNVNLAAMGAVYKDLNAASKNNKNKKNNTKNNTKTTTSGETTSSERRNTRRRSRSRRQRTNRRNTRRYR